ncbi:hypothetical protein ACM66B_001650 [Microbotryomycetes sp. NB124-2]
MSTLLNSPALEGPVWLQQLALPLCTKLGLPKLAGVVHITIAACAASFALQKLSSVACPRLFPKYYPKVKAKQDDWDLHVVGWAYALVATPLAIAMIRKPSLEITSDLIYGYGQAEGRMSAFATGYFLWDAIVSARHISTQGLGFFLHGAGCMLAFLFTLKPFLMFCGPNFLIWELSTIFLNAHWYLDKFQLTGSIYQMINGAFLVMSYIAVRLVWGTYNSYQLWILLLRTRAGSKIGNIKYLYLGLNILMNGLNFFWFRAMLLALRKRFVSKNPGDRKEAIQVDGKLAWNKDKKAT